MSKNTEKELAKLLQQCESALHVYADKTGASVFAEALSQPISARTGADKALSDKALANMAKGLADSTVDANERMAKLEAKLVAKTNDLEQLKRQRQAIADEQEAVHQAAVKLKRKSMYRTPDESAEAPEPEPVISGERIVLGKMKFGSHR